MSGSNESVAAKYAMIAGAALALGGTIYVIRSRRRAIKSVVSPESFILNRNSSWISLSLNRLRNISGLSLASEDQQHPEGPNIGYNSNNSWFSRETSSSVIADKLDQLHNGHMKGEKLIIVMVGLPGRGKTYIARKIARYLRWISYRTRAFSLAKYRLDRLGTKTAEFFDPTNSSNYQQRMGLMTEALDDALRYLQRGGDVAILDGTNTTKDRRQNIRDKVNSCIGLDENSTLRGCEILWIESYSDKQEEEPLTESQIEELKASPDFLDKEDYENRLRMYSASYQSLEEDEGSFIKVYDDGRKLTLHKIHGFLRTKIVSFVMNLHRVPRPIYMVRHGESDFNVRALIGGDSGLSPHGRDFSRALGEYLVTDELGEAAAPSLNVWASTMRRARETAAEIPCKKLVEWRSLREIEVGVCDGLSFEQMKVKFPEEYRARDQDKLRYRYPRGESYMDVIVRLEPVIFEMERQQEPLLIVAHQASLRCLYAYFLDLPTEEIPFLSIPLHTLIRLEAKAYGCKEKRMKIVVDGDVSDAPSTPRLN